MKVGQLISVFAVSMLAAVALANDSVFTTLPLCRRTEGKVEIKVPNSEEWQAAEEGKFYPLGCSYRTGKGGRLVLAFGPNSTATIADGASFGTRAQLLDDKSRTLILLSGTVDVALADNMPEGKFFVTAPGFTVKNPAGESRYTYEDTGDGDRVVVRCVTGSMGVEGRHFDIPVMRAANEFIIRTSHDHLSTILDGTSGDYVIKLDQGVVTKDEIDDNGQIQKKVEKGVGEWHLSPATRVVINRALPAIGERMSVHTMAFDAVGERKSEFCFCEGRAEVNSGELVAKQGADGEELAKKAAEATETTEATDVDESPAEGEKKETSTTEE